MDAPPPPGRDWHSLAAGDVAAHFAVDPAQGLSEAEAQARLAIHGANRFAAWRGRSPWSRFAAQLAQPLVLVLIAAGTTTAMLDAWTDSAVIFGVVLVNAVIGYIQEGKAEQALAALARAVATATTVLRGGTRRHIDAAELVPGDMVWLAAGDKVPADLRLVGGKALRTIEAALTGESVPAAKHAAPLPADTPLADRRNMAYAGTAVAAGQGSGIVVATGSHTETGKIAGLIAAAPDFATPLTRQMARFSRQLLVAILLLAALTFVVGMARGETALAMFMAAVALAVGAIPEGLPAAITITLAIGVGRMARRRAIVRRLPAVEALGSTTVICTDKTGTLTENAMTVRQLWAGAAEITVDGDGYRPIGSLAGVDGAEIGRNSACRETLIAGVLCNDAALHHSAGTWTIAGDPTEAALLVAARKGGFDDVTLRRTFPRHDEIPFDSTRQFMATLNEIEGRTVFYVKGAPEAVLRGCRRMLGADGGEQALDLAAATAAAASMAHDGLRVLALARSDAPPGRDPDAAQLPCDMVLLGLVGMIDPPRAQAVAAVRACHAAGIRVKMITGDHADTARAVARQVGIDDAGTLGGRELAALDGPALRQAALNVDVFARVEPEQKLRLVGALQAAGEVVAMTGDGVNDAPALQQADLGIAMGRGGTEVAREAAAMVLTDDDFATIAAAVEEGRGIYDNLVKFVTWTLPTNIGEGLVIVVAVLAGVTLPITPLQILWINMTTAVLLGLPLAFEPAERDIMRRPPRPPAAALLDAVLAERIVLVGILMLAGCFGLFLLTQTRGSSLAEARTVAVNAFVAIEIVYLFSCRSLRLPVTAVAAFANPWVWWGSGLTAALQLALTYWPPLAATFGTAPIGARSWCEIGAVASAALGAIEIEKRLRR